jgi:hypothetical protein
MTDPVGFGCLIALHRSSSFLQSKFPPAPRLRRGENWPRRSAERSRVAGDPRVVRPFRPRRRWGIGAQARSRRRSPWVRGCTAISILPWFASPASVGTYAGFTVVYAVGTEPPQDGYSRVPMCTSRSASSRNQTSGMAGPTSRQGHLTASEARMRNHSGSAHGAVAPTEAGRHYAGAPVAGSKTRPSRHIACITTASLRARARA